MPIVIAVEGNMKWPLVACVSVLVWEYVMFVVYSLR